MRIVILISFANDNAIKRCIQYSNYGVNNNLNLHSNTLYATTKPNPQNMKVT